MRVTKENVESLSYYAGQKRGIDSCGLLLCSLLDELSEINSMLGSEKSMFIDYENVHTDYSPERTDPCPDYYGCFTLRWVNEPSESIGDFMTLEELDLVLCVLKDVL